MKIAVSCPQCAASFRVEPKPQACRAKCTNCGSAIIVPAAGDLSSGESSSSPTPTARPRPVQGSNPTSSAQRPTASNRPAATRPPLSPLDALEAAAQSTILPAAPWSSASAARPAAPASDSNRNLLIGAVAAGAVAFLLLIVVGVLLMSGGKEPPVASTSTPAAPTTPSPVSPTPPTVATPTPTPTATPVTTPPAVPVQPAVIATPPSPTPDQRPSIVPAAEISPNSPSKITENSSSSTDGAAGSTALAPADGPLTLPELVERIEPSVVRINAVTNEGQVLGSGFVVDTLGTVVTNHHVIAGTRDAKVTFANKKSAKVLGYLRVDASKDLAVLRIDTNGLTLQPVPLAAELPRKGEQVVAFGAPIGLSFSATDGIVSAIRDGSELNQYGAKLKATIIQTSTPISSGNSGGPLVNMRGELIGVNSAGLQIGQNLNFSVAVNEVRDLLSGCDANTPVVATMPAAPPRSRTRPSPEGTEVVVSEETPEEKLKKPLMPSELRDWEFSGVKTKARIVELTSADADRRDPTKLTEKDFDTKGRYQLPKKIRVVFELESGKKRTVPDTTLEKENREAVQQFWKDHAYYFIKSRIVKKGGDLVEDFAEAGGDRDMLSAQINIKNLSLLYILSDITLPPDQSEEAIGLINQVLEKYMTRTGNRQLKTLLNEMRQQVKGEMSSRNIIAGGSLVAIFKSTLLDN